MQFFKAFLISSAILALIAFFPVPKFVYILLAITFMYAGYSESWNIVGGYTGYLSIGHGALFGGGAYIVALLWYHFEISPLITPFLAGFVSMLIAICIGYPTMRLRGFYFALATLSLPIIMAGLVNGFPEITLAGRGISNIYAPEIPFEVKPEAYYLLFLLYMIICTLISYKIENSKFGIGLFAIREDEDAAIACGVNATKLKVEAFMISGFLTGLAGGLFSSYLTYVSPVAMFSIILSVSPVLMSILGGKETYIGPIIGAFTLDLLRNLMAYAFLSVLNELVLGIILIIIVLIFPQGILGVILKRGKP